MSKEWILDLATKSKTPFETGVTVDVPGTYVAFYDHPLPGLNTSFYYDQDDWCVYSACCKTT